VARSPSPSKATIPATAPPKGRILACADDARTVAESSEANNCRTTPDDDRDGFANFGDCAPRNAAINPGVNDRPDVPAMRDTNCDKLDGNARRAVFVSPIGDDADPGSRARPKASFGAAVEAAAAQRRDVYATLGTYAEGLVMRNGVGVYGGYAVDWKRSLTNRTRVTGAEYFYGSEGAVAYDIAAATTLQFVTLEPRAPTTPGASSYGFRGVRSPALLVERVTATAAAGRAGPPGADGADGLPGGSGLNLPDPNNCHFPGGGGSSPAAGRRGGHGGTGSLGRARTGSTASWTRPASATGWAVLAVSAVTAAGETAVPATWGTWGLPALRDQGAPRAHRTRLVSGAAAVDSTGSAVLPATAVAVVAAVAATTPASVVAAAVVAAAAAARADAAAPPAAAPSAF